MNVIPPLQNFDVFVLHVSFSRKVFGKYLIEIGQNKSRTKQEYNSRQLRKIKRRRESDENAETFGGGNYLDREGEEKGGKLKENQEGKSVRSCGEGKLFCRKREEEGRH